MGGTSYEHPVHTVEWGEVKMARPLPFLPQHYPSQVELTPGKCASSQTDLSSLMRLVLDSLPYIAFSLFPHVPYEIVCACASAYEP